MHGMKLTDRLRQALGYAEMEAAALGVKRVHAGHVLVGLLREHSNVAAVVLRNRGATIEGARRGLRPSARSGRGGARPRHRPPPPTARAVLAAARRHSESLADGDVGSQHVLLAMAESGRAAAVFSAAGLVPSQIREDVLELVGGGPRPSGGPVPQCPT